jgi:hypothetical protein
MNTRHRSKSVVAVFGLAAASMLLTLGAEVAHAGEFDPQSKLGIGH